MFSLRAAWLHFHLWGNINKPPGWCRARRERLFNGESWICGSNSHKHTNKHTLRTNAAWGIAVGRHRVESRFVTYISCLLLMPRRRVGTSHSADISATWSSAHTPSRTLIVWVLILSHQFLYDVSFTGIVGYDSLYCLNETAEEEVKNVTNSQRLLFQKVLM